MFRIGYRTIKTALGAAIAIGIAQAFQLDFFASAGIITILCIQKTRRKSFQMSWARFLACIIGLLYAGLLFEYIAYHPITVGVLLLLFIPTTLLLKIQAGIVTSSVIILHIYTSGQVTLNLILNELALISIGIFCALLMNAYMPSVETKLSKMQQQLERNFSKIFQEFSVYVKTGQSTWSGKEITNSATLLEEAQTIAAQNLENHLLRYDDQYYHYFKMREKQLEIIERMMPLLTTIEIQLKQGEMVADYMKELSEGVNPGNTSSKYVEKLDHLKKIFKNMPLPETREEFEARSALMHLVYEINEYLLIKQQFKPIKKYSIFR
ncbi:aromatic acid exporter family protein [Evansella tamaricis]|uniref:Aromatic acid exporter family protein n=1 Tax=Evansella tamaricis TaxID=2069301 RepID=A0ABS6JM03_9BACI|nr:aromatic acid exporter family protein [Evansella tamaricis]MBU9714704.1 aromatic acid exporter family protein [Evansella tamaricis]